MMERPKGNTTTIITAATILASLAAAILLLAACSSSSSSNNKVAFDEMENSHRNLRFSFFNDPKSVELKLDPSVAATSNNNNDNAEHHQQEANNNFFHALTHPSQNNAPPPLSFHLRPNNPQTSCDNIVLLLPDGFAGHGIGSQLNSYIVAALTATYLDRALVILGEDEFLGGCPADMIEFDEVTQKATNNYSLHFNEQRNEFPKSLMRLVDHPTWLSRNCPVPTCGNTYNSLGDWKQVLKTAADPKLPAAQVQCQTTTEEEGEGREGKVMVMDGPKTMQMARAQFDNKLWVDRSTDESLVVAYNWALRLGADVDEASIFASLKEHDDILDYVMALSARSGIMRFQPWIMRDVDAYIQNIDKGGGGGGGDNVIRIQKILESDGQYYYGGIHVRRGDKLDRESKAFVNEYWRSYPGEEAKRYIPLRQYLAQFAMPPTRATNEGVGDTTGGEVVCGTRHVYIATDDPTEVHKEIEELPKDENGLSKLTEDNNCLKFSFSFGPPLPGNRYHNLSFKRGRCDNLYNTIIAGIADLTLLARSGTFVGECNSNWGRMVRSFRLEVNDVTRVRDNGERPVVERDTRIAWGNKHAKYIWSWDWKLPNKEEEEERVAAIVAAADPNNSNGNNNHQRRKLFLDPKSVALKHPTTNFFIDIATFTEGFSGWKVTLGQVLAMVETIPGASLVEPCMINGRLKSCTTPYPQDLLVESGSSYAPVPISEIFDMEWAFQPREGQPPVMTSFGDFLQRTQQPEDGKPVQNFHVCLKASQPECPAPYVARLNGKQKASAKNDDEISVYTIYMCWWGRCALELSKNFKGTGDRNMSLPRSPVAISPKVVNTVKEVLARANIVNEEYSLIHWRGERKRMDYIKCAETVVAAKNNMSNGIQSQYPFLIMTSLNEDANKQWNGDIIANIASNGTPKEALDILERNGFIRFDKLLQNANIPIKDPGMLVLYELILATLSKQFSTCALAPPTIAGAKGGGIPQGCSQEQFSTCHECNYMGKFARLALDMRLESGHDESSTTACWPV